MKRSHWIFLLWTLYLLLPLSVIGLYSITRPDGGLTFVYYRELFAQDAFWQAMGHTSLVVAGSVALALLLMTPLSFAVVVYAPRLEKWVKVLMMTPYALPGVVTATALMRSYGEMGVSPVLLLGGAYCLLVMPLVYQSLRNSLSSLDILPLTQAAQTLGASPWQIFLRVALPCVLPGILGASLISVSALFGEFVLSSILVGSNWPTVQYYLYLSMKTHPQLSAAVVTTYIGVMFVLCLLVLTLTPRQPFRNQ